ncbi:(-)-5-epieremophilene synthase STPS3-like isoform X2 [Andrographis paniculata]|uniref:(-)-5-epieremophilene synthase STPS3-like isoform X2 n=1 Tax=Andrographis paniculata TaxID=175694 RepID=UPI0021E759E5|nr:(-)-5-epieremophilene synthase STPS3-like isoform X2 [Andrographis paniculata]
MVREWPEVTPPQGRGRRVTLNLDATGIGHQKGFDTHQNHSPEPIGFSPSPSRTTTPKAVSDRGDNPVFEEPIIRQTKDHPASFWNDALFSAPNQVDETHTKAVIETLKEKVRRTVMNKESKAKDKMILIDTIERLGLAYHFEKEIDDQIAQIFESEMQNEDDKDSDLFSTALHFRLFRQHGYNAPSGVFNKFTNDDGTFKEAFSNDIKGLLSLYEATYLRYPGEHILKNANLFATRNLKQALPLLEAPLNEKVARALIQPLQWGVPRVEAHYYISIYEKEESKNELLLKLAKLDFNLVQNLYREELSEFIKWYNGWDLKSKLPYVRDWPVEIYFCAMVFISRPRYSLGRSLTAKNIILMALIDDTSDCYATLEEAKTFLEVLQERWDIKKIGRLPHYMQIIYEVVLSTYEEFDQELSKQGRSFAGSYAMEELKFAIRSYLTRAKWYVGGETPTFQESISNACVDSVTPVTLSSCMMGMEFASKEAFEWLLRRPKIVEAAGLYTRLINDIASYEREQNASGFPSSSIDCYMKDYGASKEEAMAKFHELAEDAWMEVNREWVSMKGKPKEFLMLAVNAVRFSFICYNQGTDGLTYSKTGIKKYIEAAIFNPIEIGDLTA